MKKLTIIATSVVAALTINVASAQGMGALIEIYEQEASANLELLGYDQTNYSTQCIVNRDGGNDAICNSTANMSDGVTNVRVHVGQDCVRNYVNGTFAGIECNERLPSFEVIPTSKALSLQEQLNNALDNLN